MEITTISLLAFWVVGVLFIVIYHAVALYLRLVQEFARQEQDLAAGRGRLPPKGITMAVLMSVPAMVYEKEEGKEEECAICLTSFEEMDMYRVLPNCKHMFHRHCTDMWFTESASCPVCRAKVDLGAMLRSMEAEGMV